MVPLWRDLRDCDGRAAILCERKTQSVAGLAELGVVAIAILRQRKAVVIAILREQCAISIAVLGQCHLVDAGIGALAEVSEIAAAILGQGQHVGTPGQRSELMQAGLIPIAVDVEGKAVRARTFLPARDSIVIAGNPESGALAGTDLAMDQMVSIPDLFDIDAACGCNGLIDRDALSLPNAVDSGAGLRRRDKRNGESKQGGRKHPLHHDGPFKHDVRRREWPRPLPPPRGNLLIYCSKIASAGLCHG